MPEGRDRGDAAGGRRKRSLLARSGGAAFTGTPVPLPPDRSPPAPANVQGLRGEDPLEEIRVRAKETPGPPAPTRLSEGPLLNPVSRPVRQVEDPTAGQRPQKVALGLAVFALVVAVVGLSVAWLG